MINVGKDIKFILSGISSLLHFFLSNCTYTYVGRILEEDRNKLQGYVKLNGDNFQNHLTYACIHVGPTIPELKNKMSSKKKM